MGNIGVSELLLIFLVALLVFGAKRIPEIARGLGQALREFRSATREIADELQLDEGHRSRPVLPPVENKAAPPPAPQEARRPDDQQPALPVG